MKSAALLAAAALVCCTVRASAATSPQTSIFIACLLQALEWFEGTALTRHEGPYLMGAEFSMLDIMMISSMERIGAGVFVLSKRLLFCYVALALHMVEHCICYGGHMSG
jgi:hypothetical protein